MIDLRSIADDKLCAGAQGAAAVAGESDEPSNIQSGLNDIDVSVEEDVKAMGEASKGQ